MHAYPSPSWPQEPGAISTGRPAAGIPVLLWELHGYARELACIRPQRCEQENSALVRRHNEDREGQAWDASFASRREMRPGTRRFGGPPMGCLAALRADLVSLPRQW